MDDATFPLATCVCLGVPWVSPHFCRCAEAINSLGHHGLSCNLAGWISQHANINEIIRSPLTTTGVAAVREPNDLVRDNGKRLVGKSLLALKMGRTNFFLICYRRHLRHPRAFSTSKYNWLCL